jgi:hypothetical protein
MDFILACQVNVVKTIPGLRLSRNRIANKLSYQRRANAKSGEMTMKPFNIPLLAADTVLYARPAPAAGVMRRACVRAIDRINNTPKFRYS